jgi:pilus assembly protein FimV
MPTKTKFKTSALTTAVAISLACLPLAAEAAGLGRLTVYSGLGQPLRAEIEVNAARDEFSGMTARLAPPDAFRQAGIDYASTLLGLRFAVEKRSDGKAVIRLSSDRPISDPFVDVLLELNWATGRLVREYTFLLDPPEVAAKVAPAVATVEAKTPAGIKTSESRPAAAVVEEKAIGQAAAPVAAKPAPVAEPAVVRRPAGKTKADAKAEVKTEEAPAKAATASAPAGSNIVATRPVKAGDTLRKIASETQHEGVSLEQMLVGLFRANQDAFDGGNMNRMRAGAIIGVPDKEAIAAVSEQQAKKIYVAQSHDWNNYRRKLAGAVADGAAREEPTGQSAAGRITAKVEDKAKPVNEAKDQVKVAKSEPGKAGKQSSALEEDLIAKDKALKEANQRLAALEKNVAELQKLLAMKSQDMAELQKQAAKPEEKKPEPAKVAEAKPAEPSTAKAPETFPDKIAEKAAEAPAATPPAGEEKPPEAPKPVAKPKPVAPPPPPAPEPSFIDGLVSDPLPLAGLGGVAALLLGWLFYKRRRAQADLAPVATDNYLPPSMPRSDTPVGKPAASADATKTPLTDFSQAGPGTIDTDEVDPVAEADVYIAYGRDAQAEEILLEAQQKDPQRIAVPAKLLEIYAKRQDGASFEAVARGLQLLTGAVGPDWEKALALGASFDPTNPLYASSPAAAPAAPMEAPAFDADATLVEALPLEETAAAPADELVSLDFDLPAFNAAEDGVPAETLAAESAALEAEPVAERAVADMEAASDDAALDFDLGTVAAEPLAEESPLAAAPVEDGNALDFDFELPGEQAAAPLEEVATESVAEPAAEPVADGNVLDFDFELGGDLAAPEENGSAEELAPVAEVPLPGEIALDFDVAAAAAPALDDVLPAAATEAVTEPALGGEVPADAALEMLDFELPAAETAAEPETAGDMLDEVTMPELAEFSAEPLAANEPEAVALPDLGVIDLPAAPAAEPENVALSDFDFDLPAGSGADSDEEAGAETLVEQALPAFDLSSINLDLDAPDAAAPAAEADVLSLDAAPAEDEPLIVEPAAAIEEITAEEIPVEEAASEVEAAAEPEEIDLSAFELPVEPGTEVAPGALETTPAGDDAHSQEVATKLDLAKAYEEMGDQEGARELLEEVLAEGNAEQQEMARQAIARLD